MFCPKCGKQIIEGAAFCMHCGSAVVQLQEETPRSEEKVQIKTVVQPVAEQPQTPQQPVHTKQQTSAKTKSTEKEPTWKTYLVLALIVIAIIALLVNSLLPVELEGTWEAEDGTKIVFSSSTKGYIKFPDPVKYSGISYEKIEFTYYVSGNTLTLKPKGEAFDEMQKINIRYSTDKKTILNVKTLKLTVETDKSKETVVFQKK